MHCEDATSNSSFEISFQTVQNLALEPLDSLPPGKGKVVPVARV